MINTWRCDVCGETRPDDKIGVSWGIKHFKRGGAVQVNVKYCTDKPDEEKLASDLVDDRINSYSNNHPAKK